MIRLDVLVLHPCAVIKQAALCNVTVHRSPQISFLSLGIRLAWVRNSFPGVMLCPF